MKQCPKCGFRAPPRSLDQNALVNIWYRDIADQLGDRTALEARNECKLRHGVPILREQSEQFRRVYDRCIKPLPYEEKLEAMVLVNVSSIMTKAQMTKYMGEIEHDYERGQGVILSRLAAA